jgi:hypothetical protein
MNILDTMDIDYVCTVTVERPVGEFDGAGNLAEGFTTVAEDMPADIQLSLEVRSHVKEDGTGADGDSVWIMFCMPPERIREGDRVCDGDRVFTVDAVGDWGSHTECVMSMIDG